MSEKFRLTRQALSTKKACSTTDVSMNAIMYRNMTGSTVIRCHQRHLCGLSSSAGTCQISDVTYKKDSYCSRLNVISLTK
jgi:hypothetical protein